MVSDAAAHAEEDLKMKELAQARNEGESAAYQSERQLVELADKISAEEKESIESANAAVRETLKNDDPQAIREATATLMEAFYAITTAMYEQAAESADNGEEDIVEGVIIDDETAHTN